MNPMIHIQREGSVARLSLNRPERHNSLTPELLREFLAALGNISDESGCHAVILEAKGRSFSTGGDLGGFYDHLDTITAYAKEVVGLLNQAILALIDLPMPVIAAVHGIVTGGSLGLVLASDLVLVSPQASFTPYYAMVGFSPDGGWTAILPEIIGAKRAADILMANRTITAEEALAWGLVNRIVPAVELPCAALELAHTITIMQPGSIQHTKRLLSLNRDELAARLAREQQHFVAQIATLGSQQHMVDFLNKMKS